MLPPPVPDTFLYPVLSPIPEHLSPDQHGSSGAFDSPPTRPLITRRVSFDLAGMTSVFPRGPVQFIPASTPIALDSFPLLPSFSSPTDSHDLS